jgi:hypothetical protein
MSLHSNLLPTAAHTPNAEEGKLVVILRVLAPAPEALLMHVMIGWPVSYNGCWCWFLTIGICTYTHVHHDVPAGDCFFFCRCPNHNQVFSQEYAAPYQKIEMLMLNGHLIPVPCSMTDQLSTVHRIQTALFTQAHRRTYGRMETGDAAVLLPLQGAREMV